MISPLNALTLKLALGKEKQQDFVAIAYDKKLNLHSLQDLLNFVQNRKGLGLTEARIQTFYAQAVSIQNRASADNVHLLTPDSDCFPIGFKSIAKPPALIFVKGNPQVLKQNFIVTIIGTRALSKFAGESATMLGRSCASQGAVVVSGLAVGCDTAAHEGCLAVGGKTVAVLAGGVNRLYPRENINLAARIVNSGGCLLTEYLPDEVCQIPAFIDRNRLQSALASAVIVVESAEKGGSMHTAKFAKAQRKNLISVVHPKGFVGDISGNAKLLREGAVSLTMDVSLEGFVSNLKEKAESASLPQSPAGASQLVMNFFYPVRASLVDPAVEIVKELDALMSQEDNLEEVYNSDLQDKFRQAGLYLLNEAHDYKKAIEYWNIYKAIIKLTSGDASDPRILEADRYLAEARVAQEQFMARLNNKRKAGVAF